jgi:hypothetical protein
MTIKTDAFNPLIETKELNGQTRWYHFSVDDVFDSLIEITDNNVPLFEHPTFKFFKSMHTMYGARVGLNLFFQKEINGKIRTLREVRDLSAELQEAGWIYFGPHALDFETAPYSQSPQDQIKTFDSIYEQIYRFAGKEFCAKFIRLHFYSESYELAEYFASHGVEALFSTDRPAGSHRMPEQIAHDLISHGRAEYRGMNFIRTQFRIEFFVDEQRKEKDLIELFKVSLDQYGCIILYTHEYELVRPEIIEMMERALAALQSIGLVSSDKI